jgi:hypothetical protein
MGNDFGSPIPAETVDPNQDDATMAESFSIN